MASWLRGLAAAWPVILVAACGGEPLPGELPGGCQLETFRECSCLEGGIGKSVCEPGGAFGECICEGAGGTGGGAGGGGGEGGTAGSGGEGGTAGGGGVGGSAGGGGAGGAAGGGGAGDVGCGSVPVDGVCLSDSIAQYCVIPSGQGEPQLKEVRCASWEGCVEDTAGARCVAEGSGCVPGARICDTDGWLAYCTDFAEWDYFQCQTSCHDSPLGAYCDPDFQTSSFTGTLLYEARSPNSSMTGWGVPAQLPAREILVASVHAGFMVDATLTEVDGSFSVKVPSRPAAGDRIIFLTMQAVDGGARLSFSVAYPGPETGRLEVGTVDPDEASTWSWSLSLSEPSGQTWVIDEDLGSPAIHLFEQLRQAWSHNSRVHGFQGDPVVMWYGPETTWDCGACFARYPVDVGALRFDTQIWMPGDAEDAAYWSAPVAFHELGHWSMSSFGVSPNEGGRHCLGARTMPGLAWSEGWATFYSADLRNSPAFYDKQDGTFFWFNVSEGNNSFGRPLIKPTRAEGLLQQLDENWVAQTLWRISRAGGIGGERVQRALSHERMTRRPFGRGYTTHTFSVDSQCRPTNIRDTRVSAPMLADFLDSLVCTAVQPSVVTTAVSTYPYPADAPICP